MTSTSSFKLNYMSFIFKRINLRKKRIENIFVIRDYKSLEENSTMRTSNRNPMIKFTNINRNIIHIKHIISYLCEYGNHK